MGPRALCFRRMKPAPFHYHTPSTIDETLDLLAKFAADDGRVLAGGQSLVPTMAFRLARPRHLIDINGIRELDYLEVHNGKLCIGAGVRHAAFARPVVRGPARAPADQCGSPHRPCADPQPRHLLRQHRARRSGGRMGAVAAALDAEMVAESKRGGLRVIAAKDFFKGVMTTALRDDELLTRGAAADPAGRCPGRFRRVQPPRRRLCGGDGGDELPAEEQHHERPAHRRRRRRGRAAPPHRGRAASCSAGRPTPASSRLRRMPRRARSIRSTMPTSATITAAASCAPWCPARWSNPAHE